MAKEKIKVFNSQAGYDLAASFYDKKEKYLNSFEKGSLAALLSVVKDKKILEVGAGTGRLTSELVDSGAIVTALDISEKMLQRLKSKNKNVETIVADAESLPFLDGTFDLVIAAFLIVHLKDPGIFFKEAHRVLKNDGLLILSNINQKEAPPVETEKGKIKIESYYHRPDKILSKLEDMAFTIVREEFINENGTWINQIITAQK